MPQSSSTSYRDVKSVLETKPLKFEIKTGGFKYICELHTDRASYERSRPVKSSSASSDNSSVSSSNSK